MIDQTLNADIYQGRNMDTDTRWSDGRWPTATKQTNVSGIFDPSWG